MLFLTSLGGTARDFQPLAVSLMDHFHVLGLTRRGQGESAKPDTGYETFQDAQNAEWNPTGPGLIEDLTKMKY